MNDKDAFQLLTPDQVVLLACCWAFCVLLFLPYLT